MIYCKIENGVVVNTAEFDGFMPEGWDEKDSLWVADSQAYKGWTYDGKVFTKPPEVTRPPRAVPPDLIGDLRSQVQELTGKLSALQSVVVDAKSLDEITTEAIEAKQVDQAVLTK